MDGLSVLAIHGVTHLITTHFTSLHIVTTAIDTVTDITAGTIMVTITAIKMATTTAVDHTILETYQEVQEAQGVLQ